MIERGNGRFGAGATRGREPSIGELFGQLSNDASRLIQQELALAMTLLTASGLALGRSRGCRPRPVLLFDLTMSETAAIPASN